jgi:hypothetical protein
VTNLLEKHTFSVYGYVVFAMAKEEEGPCEVFIIVQLWRFWH